MREWRDGAETASTAGDGRHFRGCWSGWVLPRSFDVTREDLIAQLHGVHLPAAAVDTGDLGIAQWPLWSFAAIALVFAGIRWWRQNAWRREARAALRQIERVTDLQARWRALLDLAIRIAHVRGREDPLPAFAYRAPDTVGDGDADALARHIRSRLAR